MEIKVRELTDVEEKSVQQVEQELLEKHEAQQELKFEEDLKVEVEKKDTNTTSESESIESQTEEPKKKKLVKKLKRK